MNNLVLIPRHVLAGTALGAVILLSGCGTLGSGSEPAGAASPGESGNAETSTSAAAEPAAAASNVPSVVATNTQEAEPGAEPSTAPSQEPSTEGSIEPEPSAGAPSPSSDAVPAPVEPAAGGTCTAAMLTGRIDTVPGAAGMGKVYRSIVLTNTSSAPCTTVGFPGVSAVTAEGDQIGLPADRDDSRLTVLTLAPGASATATLKQGSGQNYGADCGTTPVAGLRVYPPGATDSLVLEQHGEACSATSIVLMTVGTLQPAQ
ncbi:DUF4232 domain-containing protein [Arthrobacter sp. H41]|uniref:DUF4232 domain-containing protein n=1 Tax=Arthrobacter sp. H41 TaxID=1312978 RepID=UPI0004B9C47D|nr:DUF4232 domain-containing protein [Arthrobacter sp. H41]